MSALRQPTASARTHSGSRPAHRPGRLLLCQTWLSLALLALTLAGCVSRPKPDIVIGPVYKPANVYQAVAYLPPDMRRVAVLPLACRLPQCDNTRETLEQALLTELGKAGRFELVRVTPEQLREWTGRAAWNPDAALPLPLLEALQERLGCDGVILPELTHLHSYPPMVIGWKLKLVELRDWQILWAADEVFDAAEPAVANAARKHHIRHSRHPRALTDSRFTLVSPSAFGRYTVEALAQSLPER